MLCTFFFHKIILVLLVLIMQKHFDDKDSIRPTFLLLFKNNLHVCVLIFLITCALIILEALAL